MFEKTRIRFNSYVFTTLAIVILDVPYIQERDVFYCLDSRVRFFFSEGRLTCFSQ